MLERLGSRTNFLEFLGGNFVKCLDKDAIGSMLLERFVIAVMIASFVIGVLLLLSLGLCFFLFKN